MSACSSLDVIKRIGSESRRSLTANSRLMDILNRHLSAEYGHLSLTAATGMMPLEL